MTKSRMTKLQRRFDLLSNNEKNVDPNQLLIDLIEYQKQELGRSFCDTSVQSEMQHRALSERLNSMIRTLRVATGDTAESEAKRRLP